MTGGGGCASLLSQFFLHLLSTYTDLPHLSLNQSFLCFVQLVPSISSSVGPVYVFHLLHVPLPLSKHLRQVVSKHDHITSHYLPLPVYLLLSSIPTCPSATISFQFSKSSLFCKITFQNCN